MEPARLPDTLTELIEQTLASSSSIDRSKYTPNRAVYLQTVKEGRPVLVCAAGMMLVEQFGFTHEDQLKTMLDVDGWNKLHAIGTTQLGAFIDALNLTHRLGIDRMRESERLQSTVNHKLMTAVGQAMSRHEDATHELKPTGYQTTSYSSWREWDRASEWLRTALPAIREMELFLADAEILDKRSTAAVRRLAARTAN